MRFADDDPAPHDPGAWARSQRDSLDEHFPLGDGTADTEAIVICPYCAQPVEIALDPGGGATQEYVEDCEVCCQPWQVAVRYHLDGGAQVIVTPLEA